MKTIELNVEKRSTTGKNEARRDRVAGRIPAVVYGAGKPNVAISVNRKALSDVFREGAGENAIFLLKLGGSDQSRHAMIKEMQRDPVSRKPLHIDFVRVLMDVKITRQGADRGLRHRPGRQDRWRHPRPRDARGRDRVPADEHSRAPAGGRLASSASATRSASRRSRRSRACASWTIPKRSSSTSPTRRARRSRSPPPRARPSPPSPRS